MIPLKSDSDLLMLRQAGRHLAAVMRRLEGFIRPGITTARIDSYAQELMRKKGLTPAFKGYRGYPAATCVSVNEEIVHGIPSGRLLVEGDIVSVDAGINFRGYYADAAFTVGIGRIGERARRLIETARQALSDGIMQARAGNFLGDISSAIQSRTEKSGFSVVRQFVGHGIGKELHEEPEIPNFGPARSGPELKNGMVLAIEPMINLGVWESFILDNGWTAVTKDGEPSAHFEHTVAVTERGPEILTYA
jgi:methionyl aminopeptidase